ncbi:MAG: hypothetical protein IKJ99_04825 [Oscillospiraceae bacterium]|nr:hypothetical protein [Oscillospiraceae bacterium]
MPRIRQYANRYTQEDFIKAICKAQVDANLMQKKQLAEASGIPYSTLWKRLKKPDDMSLKELKQLLTVIPIPADDLLKFVGYSCKERKRVVETMRDND